MRLELDRILLPLAGMDLNLSVMFDDGITGISGASGSGKTSLLETIAGLRRPSAGRIVLDGVTLFDRAAGTWCPPWQRRIGYVPQDQALFPHLTVEENIRYSNRSTGMTPEAGLQETITALLELTSLLARKPSSLSGGEKARVALGRALMSRPALLLLDEPMAHLDDRLRDRALEYLKATSTAFRLPVLLVSHSKLELASLCGKILRMERGSLLTD